MIVYYILTKNGERDNNEDYVGMWSGNNRMWFFLADGLGGHGKGEVASKCVVENAKLLAIKSNGCISPNVLFEYCQAQLIELQNTNNESFGMKTTLVSLHINEEKVQFSHIGDSRGYMFINGKCKFITEDHSVPMMLAKAGAIKEKDIPHHPDRNRLLKVMGVEWDEPEEEIDDPILLKKNMKYAFLLCSDGFWEWIDKKEMEKCLKSAVDAEDWIKKMEKIVIQNGQGHNMDNYSAIAVFV